MWKDTYETKLRESQKRAAVRLALYVRNESTTGPHTLLSLYKVPFALHLLGYPGEANQALDWIKEKAMVAPGEFREGDEPPWLRRSETYRSSWILSAAFLWKRHDIADESVISRFLTFQDPKTGGFYGGREPHTNRRTILGDHADLQLTQQGQDDVVVQSEWRLRKGLPGKHDQADSIVASPLNERCSNLFDGFDTS